MKEEKLRFESYDLQASGFVRPSAVLRRMQQMARDDLNDFGISYEDMRKKNMAFVVSKIALLWSRPLQGEIPLTMRTAACATHGATFPRSFVISDERGICLRAMTLWALLDFEKRSLLRPSALWKEIPVFEDLSDGLSCARLSAKKEESPDLFDRRRVYASMLDQNLHLNNCNYADLMTDLLPEDRAVKEMHITFQKEAKRGDLLAISGWKEEDSVLISGHFEENGNPCFLGRIRTFEDENV
ncbi:MAG: hypothetical protein IKD31_01250 [Clostridia bacterium]|nr:hypothetical protein [Clostridia bacterium]